MTREDPGKSRTFPKGTPLDFVINQAVVKTPWYDIRRADPSKPWENSEWQRTVTFKTGDEPPAQVIAYRSETGAVVLQCSGAESFVTSVMHHADAYIAQHAKQPMSPLRKTGIALALTGALVLGARACANAQHDGNVSTYSLERK